MSTDPSVTPEAAPADSSTVPDWPEQPGAAAPADTASADPLAGGGIATILVTDVDGFETELPCLVLDLFEHDDAEGEESTHAHVVVFPAASVVRRDRLTPLH